MRILLLVALLVAVPLSAKADSMQLQVAASADDAHAYGSAGLLISIAYPRFGQNSILEPYESAVRFNDVPIDSEDSIDSAFLEFRAHTTWSTDSVVYEVVGEDTADATAFSDRANYNFRLGNLTTASQAQVLHGTTAGSWYRSPDLADVINELVDRPDWRRDSSDIALFLRPTEESPAEVWFELYHFDAESTSAHRLNIYFSGASTPASSARRRAILSGSLSAGGR